VARKTYELDSYRLPKAAAAAGFGDFPHHDALADARACAQIVIDAARLAEATDVHALGAALSIPLSAPLASAPQRAVA
jgi:DNA polymerase-3 subunit epsilon